MYLVYKVDHQECRYNRVTLASREKKVLWVGSKARIQYFKKKTNSVVYGSSDKQEDICLLETISTTLKNYM